MHANVVSSQPRILYSPTIGLVFPNLLSFWLGCAITTLPLVAVNHSCRSEEHHIKLWSFESGKRRYVHALFPVVPTSIRSATKPNGAGMPYDWRVFAGVIKKHKLMHSSMSFYIWLSSTSKFVNTPDDETRWNKTRLLSEGSSRRWRL